MQKSISGYIQKHGLLRAGDRLGVAVSGGADSVALLRAMLGLRQSLGIVLSVVHFHHGIRGRDADADEAFVAELARKHDLAFYGDSADVPAFARDHSLSLEAAARKLRYRFFEQLLREKELDKIATAHTSDDQAETVLLRFLRGSGTRGLAGIHPVLKLNVGEIIRPMLCVSRAEVLGYLNSIGQDWREDATNNDTRHTRNRVRHQLLPILERDYNPSLRSLLGEVADASRDEEEYWSGLIGGLQKTLIRREGDAILVGFGPDDTMAPAVRRRLLRRAAELAGISLDFHHVEQLLNLAASESRRMVELPRGWCAKRAGRGGEPRVVIAPAETHHSVAGYDYELSIPSEVQILPLGTTIKVTVVHHTPNRERYNPASLLDTGLLRAPLRLRNWRPGDRLRPLHRGSEEKLKRLFQEKHVPPEQRALWPVLTSGDRVVWAKDFAVAADFAVREGTTDAVLIEVVES